MIKRSPRSTPGNRRLCTMSGGQRLLDVKVRTVTARLQRRRRLGGFFWKSLLLVVFCATAWLGMTTALDKFFFSNPEYTLDRVTLELDGVMTREDALEETGLREGENIFRIDLMEVERRLKKIPQVADIRIERHLPDQVIVTLTARDPVAWVAPADENADPFDPERALLVDATGFLMRPRLIQPEFYHLPIIYGVRSDNIRDGEPLHNEDLRRAISLLDEINRQPEPQPRVRTMNIAKGYCIEVTSDRDARVTFAPTDFPGQLARFRRLLDHCRETGREVGSVNLMVSRNTPVTFVMADPPELKSKSRPGTAQANREKKTDGPR